MLPVEAENKKFANLSDIDSSFLISVVEVKSIYL